MFEKLKIKSGHKELARRMLRKQNLTSSNMGKKYNEASTVLIDMMDKGNMVNAREYAKKQRAKANSQGYSME